MDKQGFGGPFQKRQLDSQFAKRDGDIALKLFARYGMLEERVKNLGGDC